MKLVNFAKEGHVGFKNTKIDFPTVLDAPFGPTIHMIHIVLVLVARMPLRYYP